MPDLADNTQGIAASILALKKIYDATDEQMMDVLGDEVYTAMTLNHYQFITISDMMKLADAFGLVFVMNFQSADVYLAGSEENNIDE